MTCYFLDDLTQVHVSTVPGSTNENKYIFVADRQLLPFLASPPEAPSQRSAGLNGLNEMPQTYGGHRD